MKKIVAIFLLCCTCLFAATHSAEALEELAEEHKNINEIHESQLEILNKLIPLIKAVLVNKGNILFEMNKEADLLYIVLTAEAERFNILTAKIKGYFLK